MPELPEVETIARTLAPQIIGRRIADIAVLLPKTLACGQHLLPRLKGGRIREVKRRAKLLLLCIQPQDSDARDENAAPLAKANRSAKRRPPATGPRDVAGPEETSIVLAFHLKMTGSFFVHPPGTAPGKHTRLILDLDDGRLFFDDMRTFGYCRAMLPGDMDEWEFMAGLGPEPLEGSDQELARHLALTLSGRGLNIKAALLDQRVVAGVGNIYADESLFKAGIRPDRKAALLETQHFAALAKALREILRLSIKECGSSIRDYKDANGQAGAFQNSFAVYGRKGLPCPRCGAPLASARIAGRGTVYCPRCQV